MDQRASARKRLKEYPQFKSWLKKNPDLYRAAKRDPSNVEGLFATWKKERNQQAQLKKISQGYRQVVGHIQQLQTLIEQVEGLMSNIKQLNEEYERYKERVQSNEDRKSKRTQA